MGTLILIALRNLVQHRRRTVLLGGAISAVAALVTILLCLTSGVEQTLLESATTLVTGHVNVGGFYKVTAGESYALVVESSKVEALIRKTLPDVVAVHRRGNGFGTVYGADASSVLGLTGVDLNAEPDLRRAVKVREGSIESLLQPGTVVLFKSQADHLGSKVGDLLTVVVPTPRGVNNTVELTVGAIADDLGLASEFNALVPDQVVLKLYDLNPDVTGSLQVILKDPMAAEAAADALRKALGDAGYQVLKPDGRDLGQKFYDMNREPWRGQRLDVRLWTDEVEFVAWVVTLLKVLMVITTLVLMAVVGAGIANSQWVAIRSRTREIGTMRAIGAGRFYAVAMLVFEAGFLGLFASFAGALVGALLCAALNAANLSVPSVVEILLLRDRLWFAVGLEPILTGTFLVSGCVLVVSIFPSLLAARLRPALAMHFSG